MGVYYATDPGIVGHGGSPDGVATRYGEEVVSPADRFFQAQRGNYFIFRNATPGTGVAGHAAPTTHDTEKAFIMLKNNASVDSGSKRAHLDYIKLVVTAAGTAGSLNYATHTLDTGRTYSSGGGDLTSVNVNPESTITTVLTTAKIGAVVPGQANTGSARIIAHQTVRTVIPVVGDVITFVFGREPKEGGGMPLEGTLQLERVIYCPPVIIPPGYSYHLVLWRASQSAAASYEAEIGVWER